MRAVTAALADDSPNGIGGEIGGRLLKFDVAEVPDPDFDPEIDRDHLLVEVGAFSLNYRDRAILLGGVAGISPTEGIGSEFVGRVRDVGRDVTGFKPGDRVMPEQAWPTNGGKAPGGVATNAASRQFQVLHSHKLVRVPAGMPDEIAAAFPLGAQTAYSMVRRIGDVRGKRVLVTAATSSTGLFSLSALAAVGAEPVALTTSAGCNDELRVAGAREVVVVDSAGDLAPLFEATDRAGKFHAVIDPFSDIYFPSVLQVMRFFSCYITCGIASQGSNAVPVTVPWAEVAAELMIKGIAVVGNCLGLPADLQRAISDWLSGRLTVPLDSVHTSLDTFIERALAPDRLGKVVFRYSDLPDMQGLSDSLCKRS